MPYHKGRSIVQSIIFKKNYWSLDEAKKWIKDHPRYIPIKAPHETNNYYRFRIVNPDRDKYDFRTINFSSGGDIKAVIMFPKD